MPTAVSNCAIHSTTIRGVKNESQEQENKTQATSRLFLPLSFSFPFPVSSLSLSPYFLCAVRFMMFIRQNCPVMRWLLAFTVNSHRRVRGR
jgi:hypothetical protein